MFSLLGTVIDQATVGLKREMVGNATIVSLMRHTSSTELLLSEST